VRYYYDAVGATGFFFAGTGKDFYEKTYSQNVGFIAKTSGSGVGDFKLYHHDLLQHRLLLLLLTACLLSIPTKQQM